MECAALVIATSPISTNCRFAKKESETSMTASDEIKSKRNSENESITKLPESSRRIWEKLDSLNEKIWRRLTTFSANLASDREEENWVFFVISFTAKHRQSEHRLQKIAELVLK
jgi:hypothetical protein